MQAIPIIADAVKSITRFPGWSEPEHDTGYIWFDAPLEIDGVTEAGLFLKGGALAFEPDRHVTLELTIFSPFRRKFPIDRIDWRSLSGTHSNPRVKGHEWSGEVVPETHHHAFEINWLAEKGRMVGQNLPMARPIDEDLQSFESLRDYAGKHFRINNIELVLPPDWSYLFL